MRIAHSRAVLGATWGFRGDGGCQPQSRIPSSRRRRLAAFPNHERTSGSAHEA